MRQKIRKYFTQHILNAPRGSTTGFRQFVLKYLRIIALSFNSFSKDHCGLYASSLTYYTTMALVPIIALAFAIARGLGFYDYLVEQILDHFEKNQIVLREVLSFGDKMVEQARQGVIVSMGIVLLFWSVVQLLKTLEASMNQIWKVKQKPSWRRIVADYFVLTIVGPFFYLVSTSASIFLSHKIAFVLSHLHVEVLLLGILLMIVKLVPYSLFWVFFGFVYFFMPNQKVKMGSAMVAGIIGGTLYVIMQWAYVSFQVGFNQIGAVYGSFAAFPLFLIWVQSCWLIFLFGGEICYVHQHERPRLR